MTKKTKEIKFIDLFAGIGGFHIAINNFAKNNKIKARLIFASDIDTNAQKTYKDNFGVDVLGDIRDIVDLNKIEDFDILFAGFPCQPFSKSGKREGFEDETRGTLFFEIERILKTKKPKYFLLENVSNLVSHDNGNTYKIIIKKLKELGYQVPEKPLIISPTQVGIPSLRPRVYIPGILTKDYKEIEFIKLADFFKEKKEILSIDTIFDNKKVDPKYLITEYEKNVLDMWDEFYKGIDLKIIGFPIWSEEFGKDYDISLLPKWKQDFILKNRDLYIKNKVFINKWIKKWSKFKELTKTHKKLEWQAGNSCDSIYDCLIQFRPSGVRVKRPNHFSTLVAMNHSQIVGKLKRRLTPDETKKLQSLPEDFKLHNDSNVALKQLGNAVNSKVVEKILNFLLEDYV